MSQNTLEIEREEKKELYAYQKGDIDAIFERLDNAPAQHHDGQHIEQQCTGQ